MLLFYYRLGIKMRHLEGVSKRQLFVSLFFQPEGAQKDDQSDKGLEVSYWDESVNEGGAKPFGKRETFFHRESEYRQHCAQECIRHKEDGP